MSIHEDQQKKKPVQQKQDTSSGLNSMNPPAMQLMASEGAPIQRRTGGFGDEEGHYGDTRDLHKGMADAYRRWGGMAESGDPFFDGMGPSDAQITHSKALHRPPYTPDELHSRILMEMGRLISQGKSGLTVQMVKGIIDLRDKYAAVKTKYDALVAAAGTTSYEDQNIEVEGQGPDLLKEVDRAFLHDPNLSTVDLLGPERAKHFKDIKWGHEDFPGGKTGSNEYQAVKLAKELSAIRPERRPNGGDSLVVGESEFTGSSALRKYIISELRAIPDFSGPAPGQTVAPVQPKGQRLNRHAQESFLQMREAALAEGVEIVINDSYRTPETAKANSEKSGNSSAVASYSVHSLGLAMDLNMSYGTTKFLEDTTRPFTNVMGMRTSPVHKWMFMNGAKYGWFPYQNEPWHWEYNPNGFRQQFMDEYKASQKPKEKGKE